MNEDRQLLGPLSVSILKERAAGSSAPACSARRIVDLRQMRHDLAERMGRRSRSGRWIPDMLRRGTHVGIRLPCAETGREPARR